MSAINLFSPCTNCTCRMNDLFDFWSIDMKTSSNFADTTPPKALNMDLCKSTVYFDESSVRPTRREISLTEVMPQFSDNSVGTVKSEILNEKMNFFSSLNLTDASPFILMTKASDTANNTFYCNVTVQWRGMRNFFIPSSKKWTF